MYVTFSSIVLLALFHLSVLMSQARATFRPVASHKSVVMLLVVLFHYLLVFYK